jgi:LysM repeat protein
MDDLKPGDRPPIDRQGTAAGGVGEPPAPRRTVRARRTVFAVAALAAVITASQAATGHVVVRRGDTLSALAARHGVSVAALARANGIGDPDRILAGQALRLPAGGAPAAAAAPAGGGRYLVRRGDTLSRIAAEQGASVAAIAQLNGIGDVHRITAGTWLRLPGAGGGGGAPATAPRTSSYTVRPGDNLSGIARRFGLSVRTLAGANGISNPNHIRIGAKLAIPATSAGGPAPSGGRLPAKLRSDPARLALLPTFDHWAATYGVPADLLKAMAWMESGWQNRVRSHTGAMGVGQLMPATVDFVSDRLLGVRLDPWNPDHNIRMSARFLRWLLDQTGGDQARALAAYYQGLRSIRVRGVFTETLAYVQGIGALRSRF